MERVEDPASLLTWLADRPDEEAVTGYDVGWKSSTWVLHAMYVNADLKGWARTMSCTAAGLMRAMSRRCSSETSTSTDKPP
jgi:hypothetical protein